MTYSTSDNQGPIALVREGMSVIDATGAEIGEVAQVSMGDPQTITSAGQENAGPGGIVQAAMQVFSGADGLPAQAKDRMARMGYVRIDASGLFSGHRYATSDQVAQVTGDVLRLSVAEDQLVR